MPNWEPLGALSLNLNRLERPSFWMALFPLQFLPLVLVPWLTKLHHPWARTSGPAALKALPFAATADLRLGPLGSSRSIAGVSAEVAGQQSSSPPLSILTAAVRREVARSQDVLSFILP